MKKYLVASLVAAAFVTPAAAADFAGAYVGVAATLDNINGSGSIEGLGFSGAGASAFAGYDMPIGGAFVGVEGNVDLNTADAAGVEAKWGWGVGARVGTKLNDSTAVYGRVGYQRNKIGLSGYGSDWGDGVRVGGGIETGLTDNTAVRVEFNHVNYESDITNNQAVAGLVFRF